MSNQALSMSNYSKNIPFSKIIIDSLVTQIVAQKVARKNCAKFHATLNTQKVLIRKFIRVGYLVYSKNHFYLFFLKKILLRQSFTHRSINIF